MKTIPVPTQAKTLLGLLKKAKRKSLILESPDGQRFVLASLEGWIGYEVGDDFTQNRALMKHLSSRRSRSKAMALTEVKAELGLK